MTVVNSSIHAHVSNSKAEVISTAVVEVVDVAQSKLNTRPSVAKDTVARTEISPTRAGSVKHVRRDTKVRLLFLIWRMLWVKE